MSAQIRCWFVVEEDFCVRAESRLSFCVESVGSAQNSAYDGVGLSFLFQTCSSFAVLGKLWVNEALSSFRWCRIVWVSTECRVSVRVGLLLQVKFVVN